MDEKVSPELTCPQCGERLMDELIFLDDGSITCMNCDHSYRPNDPDGPQPDHIREPLL